MRIMRIFFVTFKRPDTESLAKQEKVFFIERPARNPILTLRAFSQAGKIIAREQPKMIISTGADVTVPVCIAAKLQGIPIIYIESFCRYSTPSLTAKIMRLFADRLIYQWPQLKPFFKNGIYAGPIFKSNAWEAIGK
jgi:UDP-N-acetylglucosamine:LPS N-acetylglucosamine transferase